MPIDPTDRHYWPALRDEDFVETSEATTEYNCIAHAADNNQRWWWPSRFSYWPADVPQVVTLASFQSAYATIGYELCDDHDFEPGYEKVAIYCDLRGQPTHAARQLLGGRWSSKLGSLVDIDHANLECLAGGSYGEVAMILRRRCAD